ncbi:MAG: helix-turn-helix domain-containing protein [Planctomycetaceae bacterium]|nr:helix-turn-helix domain-containing protein [Planctomycetaceae bacterium]
MSQDRTSPRFVDIKELSQQSGLSVSTITRLKNAGQIPFYQPGGKRSRVLFPIDAIEAGGSPTMPPIPVTETPHQSPDRRKGPTPLWKKRLDDRDGR